MKRAAAVLLALVLVALMFCSCGDEGLSLDDDLTDKVSADENQTYNFVNGETESPLSYTAYESNAQRLSFDILRALYKSDKNAFYSPAGLYGQLSLIENAAAGSSLSQMKSLMNVGCTLEDLNSSSGYFFSRLEELSDSADDGQVEIESNVFFNDGIPVGQEFTRRNANYYSQGLFRLDFDDSDSLDEINDYIDSESDGLFGELVASLDSEKGIVLADTVNFSDSWLAGYESKNIKNGVFNGENGKKKAKFLSGTEYYLKAKGCTGFIKDYKNTPCKFVAILPDEGVESWLKNADSTLYRDFIDSMDIMSTCEVSLPEFSARFTGDLSPAVKDAGVDSIFSKGANLNGLSYNCKACVQAVSQGAEFSVTASGTTDDDANISEIKKPAPEAKVELNRPFIFMVVDNESYIPILMGVVSDI